MLLRLVQLIHRTFCHEIWASWSQCHADETEGLSGGTISFQSRINSICCAAHTTCAAYVGTLASTLPNVHRLTEMVNLEEKNIRESNKCH